MRFQDYADASEETDLKKIIEGYRGQAHIDLMKRGDYDDEIVGEIDQELAQIANDNGVEVKTSEDFFSGSANNGDDVEYVNRHALDTGDKAAGQASVTLKALRDPDIRALYNGREEEYEGKLDTAQREYDAAVPQEKRDAARRAALDRGDIPFATFQDTGEDGKITERLEMSPALNGMDDATLARAFEDNPSLDRRYIGEIRRRLSTPDGYTANVATLGRQQDFTTGFDKTLKEDGLSGANAYLDSLSQAIADGDTGNIGPSLEALDSRLRGTPFEQQFSKEERMSFLKDYATRSSTDKINVTDGDLDENARTLTTGEVVLPTGVLMSKPLFDRTLSESKVIPEAQKEQLTKMREQVVAKQAPQAFKTILSRRPEFADEYAEQKEAGKNDMQILDEWTGNPENKSLLKEWGTGLVESIASAVAVPLAALPAVGFDNEFSKDVLRYFAKNNQERQEFANLIGKDLGMGYDIATTIAPMVADIAITGGVATAARATVGAVARSAVKPIVKGFLGSALKAETQGLISSFAKGTAAKAIARSAADAGVTIEAGAAKEFVKGLKPTDVISAVAEDVYRHIGNAEVNAGLFASGFARSAGTAYVQIYDTLEKQTNPDGSRKLTDEQIRETAMKHAAIQGATTAFTTIGFQALGAGGVERIFSGGLTRKQTQDVFGRLQQEVGKMATSAVKDVDMKSAETMLASMMKKSLAPWWKSGVTGAVEEMPEEAIQTFLGDMDTAWATGEKFDVAKSLNSAMYAGMIGGVMGGAANVAREVVTTAEVSEDTEAAVRRSTLLETARKLDANPNLKATADAVRKLAFNDGPVDQDSTATTQEDIPQGVSPVGTESAPSGQGMATEDARSESTPEDVEYFNFVMGEPAMAPEDPMAAPTVKGKEELDVELGEINRRFRERKGPAIQLEPIPLDHSGRIYLEKLPLKHPDRILLERMDVGEAALYGRGLSAEGGRMLFDRIQLTREVGPAGVLPAKMDETALLGAKAYAEANPPGGQTLPINDNQQLTQSSQPQVPVPAVSGPVLATNPSSQGAAAPALSAVGAGAAAQAVVPALPQEELEDISQEVKGARRELTSLAYSDAVVTEIETALEGVNVPMTVNVNGQNAKAEFQKPASEIIKKLKQDKDAYKALANCLGKK